MDGEGVSPAEYELVTQKVIILMGVAGAGKTTIGQLLAEDLGWQFYDGDDFHPPANVEKMKQGIPLTDEDRTPWLDALRLLVLTQVQRGEPAIVASSALKRAYREHILGDTENASFVYLRGDYDLVRERLEDRRRHFMKPDLLDSQFQALEEPEDSLVVDIRLDPKAIVSYIKESLRLS